MSGNRHVWGCARVTAAVGCRCGKGQPVPAGTFLRGRGRSTPSGTGILSPDAQGVPLRDGAHPAARNVPGRKGRSDSAGRSAGGDGGVKRWVHHSWEEGLCLGRVVTGVRVLMWWLVSRIRLSLRCRGVGRLFLLD